MYFPSNIFTAYFSCLFRLMRILTLNFTIVCSEDIEEKYKLKKNKVDLK